MAGINDCLKTGLDEKSLEMFLCLFGGRGERWWVTNEIVFV